MPPAFSPALRFLKVLTFLFCLLFGVSVILILWGSNKGFDLTDEGIYMLLPSYPDQYPSNWTGFHILVSSIRSLIPVSIVNVRLLRITATLVANVAFATAFLAWMNSYYSNTCKTPLRYKPFLFLLLVSSTLMPYTLLPQTPGYNDLAGLSGLLAAACILLALRPEPLLSMRISRFGFIGLAGFMLVFMSFGKWSSGLALFLLLATVIPLSLPGSSPRVILRSAIYFVTGILVGLATIHFGLIDLLTFYQGLKSAIIEAAGNEHPPIKILRSYGGELLNLFLIPLKYGWWGIGLTILLAWRTERNQTEKFPLLDKALFGGILVNLTYYTLHKGLYLGSNAYVQTSVRAYVLISILLFTFWATHRLCARKEPALPAPDFQPTGDMARWRQLSGPMLLLFFLPLSIAAGTIGSLFSVGVYVFASWMGLLIILALNATHYRLGGALSLALLSAAFGLMESQFINGYLFHPYRLGAPLFKQTEPVPDLPRGAGLGFDSQTASFLSEITRLYRSGDPVVDQPVIGLYNLPGLVYLLGAFSPGAPWYQDAEGGGSVQLIPHFQTPAENNAHPRPLKARPFLLLPETLRPEVQQVLLTRLAFPAAYRLAGSARSPYDGNRLVVWIPIEQ